MTSRTNRGKQHFMKRIFPLIFLVTASYVLSAQSGAVIHLDDYTRGHEKYAEGEYAEALVYFTKAAEANPNDIGPRFYMGHVNIVMQNWKEAVENFSLVLKINPNDPHAYFSRANVYMELEDHRSAIGDYTSTINIDSTFAEAYYQRAICKYEIFERAETLCADLYKASALGYEHATALIAEYCDK